FLRANIDLMRGEYKKRPSNRMVSNLGEDAYSSYQEYLSKQVSSNLQQKFINELNELGSETGIPSEEVQMPQKIEELVNTTYKDLKAIQGQKALNKCIEDLELMPKIQKMFKDWLIVGGSCSYKNVNRNDIE